MDKKEFQRLNRRIVTGEVAGRASDPAFYQALRVLPNPDPILRAMGRAESTYDAIMSDAHVIGELRSIRAGLLGYSPQVSACADAPETPAQQLALELCQGVLKRRPAKGMIWQDTLWTMATAVLRGFRVHEVVWQVIDGYLLPESILDRPNRRFMFDLDNKLRLLTRANPVEGEETEDYKYLVTRHMPSIDNPYGQALLSSCFWPYTFKHGGFKFLYQYCERHGLPWPVGTYPAGTPPREQQELLDALLDMIESGAAAIPDGDKVQLLSADGSGELVQESMVHLCNREMSKALTSQTLATELRNVGSNAASQTARERETAVNASDRAIIVATMNELFASITRFNCGDDVIAPEFELVKEKKATQERAEMWEIAARIGKPSLAAFHREMKIPMAVDEADQLQQASAPAQFSRVNRGHEFAAAEDSLLAQSIRQADEQIEQTLLGPALAMLTEFEQQGKSLEDYLEALPALFASVDNQELEGLTDLVLRTAFAEGAERA